MASPSSTLSPGKVLDMLNNAVLEALVGAEVLRSFDVTKPPALAFTEMFVAERGLTDEQGAAVMKAVAKMAPALALACLVTPRGFFHVVSMLLPLLLHVHPSARTFATAVDALHWLGSNMHMAGGSGGNADSLHGSSAFDSGVGATDSLTSALKRAGSASGSSQMASELFRDFALPVLLPTIRDRPNKRQSLLRVTHAFCCAPESNDAASQLVLIRALQSGISHVDTLVHCLSITVSLDATVDVRC